MERWETNELKKVTTDRVTTSHIASAVTQEHPLIHRSR
jgi:hypothetical protein